MHRSHRNYRRRHLHVAGTGGSYGYSTSVTATSARLGYVYGSIGVDSSDDIFLPNYYGYFIDEVTNSTGNISQVAGNGTLNFTGNNIQATGAVLNGPRGVAFDPSGNAYIADQSNCIVRKVDTSGIITTFAGVVGQCGHNGDGISATSAYLYYPLGVATDSAGNVYIADTDNLRISEVRGGTISTFAGGGSYNPPGQGMAVRRPVPSSTIQALWLWTAPEMCISPIPMTAASAR